MWAGNRRTWWLSIGGPCGGQADGDRHMRIGDPSELIMGGAGRDCISESSRERRCALGRDSSARPRRLAQDFPDPPDQDGDRLPGRRADRFRRAPACRQAQGSSRPERHHREQGRRTGAIGADFVAKSDPDGYTLFLTTVGAVAITPNMRTDLPYDPVKDFAPVTLVVPTRRCWSCDGRPDQFGQGSGALAKDKPGPSRWPRPASAARRIWRSNCSRGRQA